jgi:hypothetical protein
MVQFYWAILLVKFYQKILKSDLKNLSRLKELKNSMTLNFRVLPKYIKVRIFRRKSGSGIIIILRGMTLFVI